MSRPIYVAIEGPIGVGKTTLLERLSVRLKARQVREVVEENPFLPLFYRDRERYAFQTQIFFLMSRFKQQAELLQTDLFRPSIIADYHLLKDRIFARLTLEAEELALYERVYGSLENQILRPDVLIYLHAPLPVLLDRIARRGRPFEQDMDGAYLTELCQAYQAYFMRYAETPILRLDNTHVNYADDPSQVDAIYEEVIRLARRGDEESPVETSSVPVPPESNP
jgi:deoxyguanosine kinase